MRDEDGGPVLRDEDRETWVVTRVQKVDGESQKDRYLQYHLFF